MTAPSRNITDLFQIYYAPVGAHRVAEFFQGTEVAHFAPLQPPVNINRAGQEAWLQAKLSSPGIGPQYAILEIPGQIFNYIDVWFRLPDGDVEHYYAGDRYPYVERAVKHASYAFPLPEAPAGTLQILVRARNATAQPMNFAALLWTDEGWDSYILTMRLWYGLFLGAILALVLYNLFLAVSLRDISYVYYVGYMLSMGAAVVLLSGLADEYIWASGKPGSLVSFFNGSGAFFIVAFVNRFLNIRQRWLPGYTVSLALGVMAMLAGFYLIFSDSLPLIPAQYSAGLVQMLSLVCAMYFIGISVQSYLRGMQQARFLALAMAFLLACMMVYFSYTHGHLPYSIGVSHTLEFGALTEGVLLSLALADRIQILEREKLSAERALLESERDLSRRMIDTQENERRVLSEALHDSIGHAVLVLKNNLTRIADNFAGAELEGVKSERVELDRAINQCGEIMHDVRRLSHDLHPHMLKRLGLRAALDSTFDRALEKTGIEWRLSVTDLPDAIDSQIELATYRVIQESLTNILKYAEATSVICEICAHDGRLFCKIQDDGKGYESDDSSGATLGVQESAGRISVLGGRYRVESGRGRGTTVRFELPLQFQEDRPGSSRGQGKLI